MSRDTDAHQIAIAIFSASPSFTQYERSVNRQKRLAQRRRIQNDAHNCFAMISTARRTTDSGHSNSATAAHCSTDEAGVFFFISSLVMA
ncbi:MAG: hypothetical protein R3F13_10475 [Prosthecobacter sp.]